MSFFWVSRSFWQLIRRKQSYGSKVMAVWSLIVKNITFVKILETLLCFRNFGIAKLFLIAKLIRFRKSWVISKKFTVFSKIMIFSKNLQCSRKFWFYRKPCSVLENFEFFENPNTQRNFEIIQFRNLAKSRSVFFLIQERKYRVSNYEHERSRILCSRKLVNVWSRNFL